MQCGPQSSAKAIRKGFRVYFFWTGFPSGHHFGGLQDCYIFIKGPVTKLVIL